MKKNNDEFIYIAQLCDMLTRKWLYAHSGARAILKALAMFLILGGMTLQAAEQVGLNEGLCVRGMPGMWVPRLCGESHAQRRKFSMPNVIDAFTRECLAIRIDRKLNSTAVVDVLSDLFVLRSVPGHVRSDNGPEFVAKAVRD